VRVFFYGLFMDESLLTSKVIKPADVSIGFVDGYRLRIAERATLVHHFDGRAYGAMMDIVAGEATKLYAEESVEDYLPEPVTVELMDGTQAEATCFNLPSDKVTAANKEYAESLLHIATRLGFPDFYLEQIRRART